MSQFAEPVIPVHTLLFSLDRYGYFHLGGILDWTKGSGFLNSIEKGRAKDGPAQDVSPYRK
jgi:hypothetical protein